MFINIQTISVRAYQEPKDPKEIVAVQVQQEIQDPAVKWVPLDPRGFKVILVPQDILGTRGLLESRVTVEMMDLMGKKDVLVILDQLDPGDHLVGRVLEAEG